MEREYENKRGFCPRCNSMDLTYHNAPIMDDDTLCFEYHCHNCGLNGEECYYVEFTGHCFYDEETEKEVDLRG